VERELSQDEQLCLAIARILLQNPPWVLIDGTFGSLDDDVLELVMDVFTNELRRTGVIHIADPLRRILCSHASCISSRLPESRSMLRP